MGSPKFSLKEALEVILPYLEHLSFQNRSSFTDNTEFKDVIDGTEYSFTLWQGRVMIPASLSSKSMMHAIPISRDVRINGHGYVVKVSYSRLLLERVKSDAFYGYLFLQVSTFVPATKRVGGKIFYSTSSYVERIDNRGEEYLGKFIDLPSCFPQKFWTHITEWAQASKAVRLRALANLESLNRTAQGIAASSSWESVPYRKLL